MDRGAWRLQSTKSQRVDTTERACIVSWLCLFWAYSNLIPILFPYRLLQKHEFPVLYSWSLLIIYFMYSSVASRSVQLFVTPWTAARPASFHYLPEFAQIPVHWVDAIQASHPLSPPSLTLFPSIRVFSSESALCIRWPKYWSFSSASIIPMNIQGWFPLGLTGWISLQSKRLSRVFSSTIIWKHQSFRAWPSLWSNSYIQTWLPGKP